MRDWEANQAIGRGLLRAMRHFCYLTGLAHMVPMMLWRRTLRALHSTASSHLETLSVQRTMNDAEFVVGVVGGGYGEERRQWLSGELGCRPTNVRWTSL